MTLKLLDVAVLGSRVARVAVHAQLQLRRSQSAEFVGVHSTLDVSKAAPKSVQSAWPLEQLNLRMAPGYG